MKHKGSTGATVPCPLNKRACSIMRALQGTERATAADVDAWRETFGALAATAAEQAVKSPERLPSWLFPDPSTVAAIVPDGEGGEQDAGDERRRFLMQNMQTVTDAEYTRTDRDHDRAAEREGIKCGACGLFDSHEDPNEGQGPILLCDSSRHQDDSIGYHLRCVDLTEVPTGDWCCPACVALAETEENKFVVECFLNKRKRTEKVGNRKVARVSYFVKYKDWGVENGGWVLDSDLAADRAEGISVFRVAYNKEHKEKPYCQGACKAQRCVCGSWEDRDLGDYGDWSLGSGQR